MDAVVDSLRKLTVPHGTFMQRATHLKSILSCPGLVRNSHRMSHSIAPVEKKVGNFSSNIKLHYPGKTGSTYKNPWDTWQDQTTWSMARFFSIAARQINNRYVGVPENPEELDDALPVVKPDFGDGESDPKSPPQIWWLGHATTLVKIDGVTVLTDPIFSERCSPISWIGSKRIRPVPCNIEELPKVDACVISHNHYDHLDLQSVVQLNARFGAALRWYVPEGTKSWMEDRGCRNVVEMTWWDEDRLPGTDVTIAFTPSQHWCKRGAFDFCQQLWGSWCVIGPRHRFFFGGDTGYCEGFKEIGAVYGPFDIAAIPIGAYEPRWFMKFAHVEPEESVKIHQNIKARKSLAIHWGTFVLTTEHYLDPPVRLRKAVEEAKLHHSDFFTLQHGGLWTAPQ